MATPVASPFGFKCISTNISATWSGATPNPNYQIAPGYATNIFQFSLVTLSGGYIVPATPATFTSPNWFMTNPPIGVLVGVQYTSPQGVANVTTTNWWAASTATVANTPIYAFVLTDPNLEFLAQTDTNPGITQAMVGANINFNAQTGNTATGVSTTSLNQASVGTGTGGNNAGATYNPISQFLPFKIMAINPSASNSSTNVSGGAYNNVIVKPNNHLLGSAGNIGVS